MHYTFINEKAKEIYGNELRKGHESDTCFDLRSIDEITYEKGDLVFVKLGVKFNFGDKYCGFLYSRSSMPIKKGLVMANGVGVIDNGYKDEVAIMFYAINDGIIKSGERVGQIMIEERPTTEIHFTENFGDEGNRGGGFGSTGEM